MGTDLRAHGSHGARRHIPHYTCLDHKRRGRSICANTVGLRQDILDRAILNAVSEVLRPEVLGLAVLRKLSYARTHHASRRAQVERELVEVQKKVDRLVDALADGCLPAEEIKGRLSMEKARKTALAAELEKMGQLAKVASLDAAPLKHELEARVSDVTALLGKHIVQARQMLRKLLADKIELEPVGSGRNRGYKFRGSLTIEKLIGGEALAGENTSVYGGPNGIRTRV